MRDKYIVLVVDENISPYQVLYYGQSKDFETAELDYKDKLEQHGNKFRVKVRFYSAVFSV